MYNANQDDDQALLQPPKSSAPHLQGSEANLWADVDLSHSTQIDSYPECKRLVFLLLHSGLRIRLVRAVRVAYFQVGLADQLVLCRDDRSNGAMKR